MGLLDFFKTKDLTVKNEVVNDVSHRKKNAESGFARQKFEVFNDLAKLRNALDDANNIYLYNRELLHEIYRQIWRDTHLQSQWTTRKMKTTYRAFTVKNSNDEINEELSNLLFGKKWFLDFMDLALDSKAWGQSLIQFGPWKNGTFNPFLFKATPESIPEMRDPIYVIDRDYVKPEYGVVTQTPSVNVGKYFHDDSFHTIFVGESHNLGFLEHLAPNLLMKDNAIKNWSEWAEVFAMDWRYIMTDLQGEERRQLLNTLEDMASNGVGVFPTDGGEVNFAGTSRSDAYNVYDRLIRYFDEQTSKKLFGQDVVSNNTGQVVGKTGENVAKLYGNSDAGFIQAIVTERLFPFMTRIGAANFDGCYLDWDNSEELTLAERADIDLKISQMGKTHSDEYINRMYNTEVESSEADDGGEDVANRIKNLYR